MGRSYSSRGTPQKHPSCEFFVFDAQLAHFFGVIFPDQEGLARAHQVFDHRVAAKWPGPFGQNFAVAHFDFKFDFIAGRVVERDTEMIHVEQALDFVQDGFEKRVRVQGGAQRAPDFVEHVKLLRAARGLLDEVTIFDGHSDLMAQRQQQAEFGRRKSPACRRCRGTIRRRPVPWPAG